MHILQTLAFITHKHRHQTRHDGELYIQHLIRTMNLVKAHGFVDERYFHIALCHDLLEDTNTTYDELEALTSPFIAEAVQILTKDKNESTKRYLTRTKRCMFTHIVKLADHADNLQRAIYAPLPFQERYLRHSLENYQRFMKHTPFERTIQDAQSALMHHIELHKTKKANLPL